MEPWPQAALLALCALIALAVLTRHTAQRQGMSLALPASPPALLPSTAFVLQAAASDRWHDLFIKLQREVGVERVFALIDDEREPFSLYSSEPAARLTQLRGAASPRVLLFNESEARSIAPQRVWLEHDSQVQYIQQPALALLRQHLEGGQLRMADAVPPFDFV